MLWLTSRVATSVACLIGTIYSQVLEMPTTLDFHHANAKEGGFEGSPEKATVLQSSSSCESTVTVVGTSSRTRDSNTVAGRDFVCPNVLCVRRMGFMGRDRARSFVPITDALCITVSPSLSTRSWLPSTEPSPGSSTEDSARVRFLSDSAREEAGI